MASGWLLISNVGEQGMSLPSGFGLWWVTRPDSYRIPVCADSGVKNSTDARVHLVNWSICLVD
jgi:hypothetical protein